MKNIFISVLILITAYLNAANVLTVSGYKDINQINVGDLVIGKDGVLNTVTGKKYFNSFWFDEQGKAEEYKYYLINERYKFFGNQNIYVTGKYNVCHVNELEVGDKIHEFHTGKKIKITSIIVIGNDTAWCKLDINGDHSYILDSVIVHNASRYWVGGGSSSNWNASGNTNWSATSGGSNNASVPTSTDDATFDGSGNSSSTISTTATILSLTYVSGYTSTTTHNAVLTIAGNVTFITGYTIAGSSAITISATSTITSNGKTWPNSVTFSTASTTKTLSGNWSITGTLTISGAPTVLNATTSETITVAGGLAMTGTVSGSAKIILTGGTWQNGGAVGNNLDIQGNVTLSNCTYNTGTLTYISGTVSTSATPFTISGSCTLNTNGITFNNITISGNSTITNNSLLTATGTFLINNNVALTMAGTHGFTIGTLSIDNVSVITHTLANGLTYTITSSFLCYKTRTGSTVLITSDHASNTANLVLQQGASCNVLANFTRINASGGRTIVTFNGTLTTTTNIIEKHDFGTTGF